MARRSQPDSWDEGAQVLLGDTMGEMMKAFNISDITWVGGSFAEIGGHNPIEPAVLAKPVLTGPYIFNFNEIFGELIAAGGAQMVQNESELADKIVELMKTPELAHGMGQKALQVIERNRGALDKTVSVIEQYL